MAQLSPPPVWINLDYLSAEAWVSGCHGLPSPHPHLPLDKYFFFPGFTHRYRRLAARARPATRGAVFRASVSCRMRVLAPIGSRRRRRHAARLALRLRESESFRSAHALGRSRVAGLLPGCRRRDRCRRSRPLVGHSLLPGDRLFNAVQLEIRILPFVATRLRPLLWLCDINFVRGEDSFVRAQWAARPLVWQIYPQQEGGASDQARTLFWHRYCAMNCRGDGGCAVREFWQAWNAGRVKLRNGASGRWSAALPAHRRTRLALGKTARKQEDLCQALVRFSAVPSYNAAANPSPDIMERTMKTAQELRAGNVFMVGSNPMVVLKAEYSKSGRNASVVKMKMKNLLTEFAQSRPSIAPTTSSTSSSSSVRKSATRTSPIPCTFSWTASTTRTKSKPSA
jgi:uncharacterized repeat protein (TIGR03837 family)